MLITYIDILFVLAGLAGIAVGFIRRKTVLPPVQPPEASFQEVILTALALIPAAVGPNILVVALTPGMPSMDVLTEYVLIPSIVLLLIVAVVAHRLNLERLSNRIWTGIWVGAVSTAALDVIRLTGFSLGWMPGNMPRMFGVLILDQMALGPDDLSDFVGGLYHYWASACFGLTYTLLVGRTRWWGGLIWGIIIEIGMMTTPPMVIAMDTGYFGLKQGFGVLGVSLTAHISYGIVLGLLLERYTKHRGWILRIVKEAFERPVTLVQSLK
ncbi:MAG: hypothetical protein HY707_03505 [Ignavibacteriae bacterium]|nr:hypothetical protein [Ignavibacteriota bacterium]